MTAILLQVVGAVLVVAGVLLISVPAGLIVGGALAALFGIALERGS